MHLNISPQTKNICPPFAIFVILINDLCHLNKYYLALPISPEQKLEDIPNYFFQAPHSTNYLVDKFCLIFLHKQFNILLSI